MARREQRFEPFDVFSPNTSSAPSVVAYFPVNYESIR